MTRLIRREACVLLLGVMAFSFNGCSEPPPAPVTTPKAAGEAPADVKQQEKDMMGQTPKPSAKPKINP